MISTSFCVLTGLLALLHPVLSITNPVYIITNAEQPSLSRAGLTPIGYKRANECLPEVPIFLIIAQIGIKVLPAFLHVEHWQDYHVPSK